MPLRIAREYGRQQASLKRFNLSAGNAKPRYLYHRFCPEAQSCSFWESHKINAPRRNIFSNRAGPYIEAAWPQFHEQLFLEEMHLPQVRCTWILPGMMAVLYSFA
jgi:hypothetical protein